MLHQEKVEFEIDRGDVCIIIKHAYQNNSILEGGGWLFVMLPKRSIQVDAKVDGVRGVCGRSWTTSRTRQRRTVVSLTPKATASSAAGHDDCRRYARCLGVVVALVGFVA